jgi:mono/diheme cytochrome c family protein
MSSGLGRMLLMAAGWAVAVVAGGCGPNAGEGLSGRGNLDARSDPPAQTQQIDYVERGHYLVTILACNDCHTPFKMGEKGPEPDMARMLSGHPQQIGALEPPTLSEPWIWAGTGTNTAFAGPWGITYAINLTPDNHTGIEIWTEEMFIKAMRTGRHFGEARQIMPPMPWQYFGQMTDDDLKSIYAYLRTIPPISNMVPEYQPPPKGK